MSAARVTTSPNRAGSGRVSSPPFRHAARPVIRPVTRKDLPLTTSLPADDLNPNMWITLRERLDADGRPLESGGFDVVSGGSNEEGDDSNEDTVVVRGCPVPPGTPLRLLAPSVPYLYVAVLGPDGEEVGPVILDVRKHPVVRLDEAVPEAIQRFARARARKARRQAVREAEEKAMQRKYLSQAFKHAGDSTPEDGASPSEPDDDARGRVTDRRRGSGKHRKPEGGSGQDDSGQDSDPDASDHFDLM